MIQPSGLYILFWVKKNRLKNGKAPIYARVKINGVRAEFSTFLEVPVLEWDSKAQFVRQKCPGAKEINKKLIEIKEKLNYCKSVLEYKGTQVTLDALKSEYNGVSEQPRMLLEIVKQHNADIEKLIGKDYVITSWRKYRTMYNLLCSFVKWKFQRNDIPLDNLKYSFLTDFEFYLKTVKDINPATNPKYIKNFQKIIRMCVMNQWLDKDPFLGYRLKIRTAERGFLTDQELQVLQEKHFDIDRLETVKDIFLFCCYTGLSYIDVFNLTAESISVGIDGNKWIFTSRKKTDVPSHIPLLPYALDFIEKYKSHPAAINTGKLFPVHSNQRMNGYLKEIADVCGIKKKLTFHMSRHTFATTIALSNGVPIESVSKMLGHRKIQTTQIYAKVLDKKVSYDMNKLKAKLGGPSISDAASN